jgi:hypothetical protein
MSTRVSRRRRGAAGRGPFRNEPRVDAGTFRRRARSLDS